MLEITHWVIRPYRKRVRQNPFDNSWLGVFQPGTLNPEPLNLGRRDI
jgi:hypothetical protein